MDTEKKVTITPDKEMLILQRNGFAKALIDNILDYKRHLAIMAVDPSYQKQNPQTGKYTGIEELANGYRKGALNAREYLKTIDEMLKADEAGTLAEAWADLDSVPAILPKEDKADEGTKE